MESHTEASHVRTTSIERRVPPLAALVVAILAIGTSAILVKWSLAPSPVKAFYRVLFTVALLSPLALTRYGNQFRRLTARDLVPAVAAGVALALHFATWFESLEWTSVAASVTLVQAQPLFVAVGAWAFLAERITRRTVLGIVVALAGMVAMSLGDLLSGVALAGARPLFGNGLALVGAVAAAGYVLAGRSLRQRIDLIPYVTVVYVACASVLLALIVAEGHPLTGYAPREWLLFLGMAVGPGLFGHTVINWALAHVESSVVSVSLLGEPVVSTVLAVALLPNQIPSAFTLAGGSVVLLGIYVTTTARSGARPETESDSTSTLD
jgi:drug/metabolite transporter (DMT)-like permease